MLHNAGDAFFNLNSHFPGRCVELWIYQYPDFRSTDTVVFELRLASSKAHLASAATILERVRKADTC